MPTAEELIVAIRSEGVSDTQDDLEGVEKSMEQTADSAGDSAEELQGFSESFQGAMTAAVAALAVGAAGLLSQVPVLGELFSGLAAVVSSLGFQMDSVLRPALTPITDALFELSNAVFNADGSAGELIGTIASIGAAAGLVVGALSALGITLTGPIIVAIAAVAAAVAGLVTLWKTDFANIRSIATSVFNSISARISRFVDVVAPIVQGFLSRLEQFWNKNGDTIISIVNFIFRTIGTVIEQAFDAILTVVQAGLQLLSGDFDGALKTITNFIRRTISRWKPLFQDVLDGILELIAPFVNDVLSDIEDLAEGIAGTLSAIPGVDVSGDISVGRLDTGGGGGGGGGGGLQRPRGRRGDRSGLTLDGRQLTESTGRFRSDSPRRRGI